MYVEVNSKSRSLGGQTDLTVIAPIKKGLVPSLESITYQTRVKRLLEALQVLRQTSHEYSVFRSVSDSAERVARIHSFRVAVIEPTNELLLAVTFDGARESYIRVLHQRIGTLLDLLFCNTEGHVPAYGNSMGAWDAWIDRIQVKTDFFYGRPQFTSEDERFLREDERQRRGAPSQEQADLASVRRSMPAVESVAWELARDGGRFVEACRQAVQTIAVLHRLTAWFIPGTPDGDFLHRAARDLLPEFADMAAHGHLMEQPLKEARIRFPEQIDWFLKPYAPRVVPLPPTAPPDQALKARIQGGILEGYPCMTHGALLLMAFKPGVDPAPFWSLANTVRTRADAQPTDGSRTCNFAFTYNGLRAAGLSEDELEAFPLEFRLGMESRASVLGDERTNHPRRWVLPQRNWMPGPRAGEAVELSAVHVVMQLRCGQSGGMPPEERIYDLQNPKHPLYAALQDITKELAPCMELLAIEPMVRHLENPKDLESRAREHFGYVDESGQPVLDPADQGQIYQANLVHPGEFIIGLPNAADDEAAHGVADVSPWLRDGSFLVVRKLAQDVKLFDEIVQAASSSDVSQDTIMAKMMGRWRNNGDPLVAPGAKNDFTYDLDPEGRLCPVHAHMRRANPRGSSRQNPPELPGTRPPRIMRRSMSFGPLYDRKNANNPENEALRGSMFMAYNARIAEQFEVVQGWLAGGNSTGGYSGRSDPFLGVPESGERRVFTFECPVKLPDGSTVDRVQRVTLDGDSHPEVLAPTLVRLAWGAYLFTPSLQVLLDLGTRAAARAASYPWSADRGRMEIERLLAVPSEDGVAKWKAALEDPDALKTWSAASIWAAIRRDAGGVLRTPYGVLAASHALAMEVLTDRAGNYSVRGYRERAEPTIGDIYLGLDDQGAGCPYRAKSVLPNQAIHTLISQRDAFDAARALAQMSLKKLVDREKENATTYHEEKWQLTFSAQEVWDEVLEGLCQLWFGLPEKGASPYIQPSVFRWDWNPRSATLYPGNFLSPSRYIFQPQPGNEVLRLGSLHGSTMNAAFRSWVKELRDAGTPPTAPGGKDAPLAKAIFDAFPRPPGPYGAAAEAQDILVAETLLGALIGFLPTVEGNLRQSLNEWLLDGTFWSLRSALQTTTTDKVIDFTPIEAALHRSMQLRPSPEVVWRRATRKHKLGGLKVEEGEVVVVAIVSATHELFERGVDDVSPVFGGLHAGAGDKPTHACPGYAAATGTLLGVLTALLETPEFLRPTPTPLAFRMEGPMQQVQPPQAPVFSQKWKMEAGPKRTLLVAGDSWFSYWALIDRVDLSVVLGQSFDVDHSAAAMGTTLADLAAGADSIVRRFRVLAQQGREPAAIVISAGGNDVVGEIIPSYVLPSPGGIDTNALELLMDGKRGQMRMNIRSMLDKLAACTRKDGSVVPVIWQGYDDPIPDGRIAIFDSQDCPSSSLCQYLRPLGYTELEDGFKLMQQVVIRYGNLLEELSQGDYKGHLIHADLRSTLNASLADNGYRTDWRNEMHPTPIGFGKLAEKLATKYITPILV